MNNLTFLHVFLKVNFTVVFIIINISFNTSQIALYFIVQRFEHIWILRFINNKYYYYYYKISYQFGCICLSHMLAFTC